MPGASHKQIVRFPETGSKDSIAVGGKGGGKTLASLISMLWHVSRTKSGALGLVCAKRADQIKFGLVTEAQFAASILGLEGCDFSPSKWTIPSFFGEPSTAIPVVYGDVGYDSLVGTLRNYNAAFSFVDEADFMNANARRELMTRVRIGRRPLRWWTRNGCHPAHPFVLDMQNNPLRDSAVTHVPLSDNHSLPAGYVDDLAATYKTQWERDRYIEGLDAPPGGLVYGAAWQTVDAGGIFTERDDEPAQLVVGVDWATKTITHAVLIGCYPDGSYHAIDEWRHDGSEGDEMSEPAQAASILDKFAPYGRIKLITVDKSSKGLRLALDQQTGPDTLVKDSSWKVVDRIAKTRILIGSGLFTASYSRCPELANEFGLYSYPEVSRDMEHAAEAKPIKQHDHGMNALEYAVEDLPAYHPQPRQGLHIEQVQRS